ncbi:MAG TPA: isoprenylcysteine carboxylmethyltransferase family protein [Thermoanaerobaculia bacterium]|nr:isoprenylcysteine carboxylmethyltransferase family protein [Thermoanaerobaculia bacterium]
MAAVFGAILFGSAGTFRWPAAWIYMGLMFGFTIAEGVWLYRFQPDLLAERMTGIGRADQEAWDKALLSVLGLAFFAWLAAMGLDAVRYRISEVPQWLQALGAIALVVSFLGFHATFRANPYLSPAVRIQTDRAQVLVDRGPYRFVRHPMYAAFVLFAPGTALLLGSWVGLLGALVLIAAVAWRAVREERLLRERLEGYAEYTQRVRYRLIPGIW